MSNNGKVDDGEVIYDQKLDNFLPIVSCYNDKIRPILDAIEKLRRLNVTQEGITLPTIVVVGDQSNGKSSVLESLAGISLPRGQGICTRVPLIMRLQHHPDPVPKFLLQYQNQNKPVEIAEESQISEAIEKATVEIAGNSKGISKVPLTLVVKKKGIPDLTMVDLPGITRTPVHGQPEDIYEQISGIIMEYISPEENIILNVLPATQDFPTCESIRMSRRVDNTGKRTLAVVTKCDQNPLGLLEKVTADDVKIGLGYICVRNRINDETYEEARIKEAKLFETHPLLSNIDKSIVGVPVLADKLVEIQSMIISKSLPDIVKKINERLNFYVSELNKLPKNLKSISDAQDAFSEIVDSLKETLQMILIRGEYDEYEDDKQMYCNARVVEKLDKLSKDLQSRGNLSKSFLVEEMEFLEKANGIRLPHFVPHRVFLCLLKKRVSSISDLPNSFVNEVWGYLEFVSVRVLTDHCGNYPQLLLSMKKVIENVMTKMKNKFGKRVSEMIEMEKITDYTCDPDFVDRCDKLQRSRDTFVNALNNCHVPIFTVEGCATAIDVKHLISVPAKTRDVAFVMNIRMTAYWTIVLKRMVDWLALQLRFLMEKLVKEIGREANKVMAHNGCIEKMLAEPNSVAEKRERLKSSIDLLKESKKIIEQVMHGIVVTTY